MTRRRLIFLLAPLCAIFDIGASSSCDDSKQTSIIRSRFERVIFVHPSLSLLLIAIAFEKNRLPFVLAETCPVKLDIYASTKQTYLLRTDAVMEELQKSIYTTITNVYNESINFSTIRIIQSFRVSISHELDVPRWRGSCRWYGRKTNKSPRLPDLHTTWQFDW